MKNKLLPSLFLITLFVTSCATKTDHTDGRAVASKEYECHFEEVVNGELSKFILSPDSLKLAVTSPKLGTEVIYLSVDNFVTGGFTYVRDQRKDTSSWDLKKIEFQTFSATPSVKVDFKRTPSSTSHFISKDCLE